LIIPRYLGSAVACALIASVAGCSVRTGAPVIDRAQEAKAAAAKPAVVAKPAPRPGDARPEFHTVRKGDTLYSIALDHGLDYRELAQWNGVTEASVIGIGQQLRLSPPAAAPSAAAPASPTRRARRRPLRILRRGHSWMTTRA